MARKETYAINPMTGDKIYRTQDVLVYGISDEEFGMAMSGDAIEHATTALLDEIIDFFPEAKRLAFKKILSATRRFEEIARKRLEAIMSDGEFEDKMVSALEQLTGLSGNALESVE